MPVEERAMVHQQVFELAARMPEPGPWNLEARTGPRHRRSRRKLAIYESDIEPRVVRHDEIASLERSKNGSFIENLARQIVIGQTGQPDDFRFQGAARILAPGLRFRMPDHAAVLVDRHMHHREFDDRIGRRIEAFGLDVQDGDPAPAFRQVVRQIIERLRQPFEYAIIGMAAQQRGRGGYIRRARERSRHG